MLDNSRTRSRILVFMKSVFSRTVNITKQFRRKKLVYFTHLPGEQWKIPSKDKSLCLFAWIHTALSHPITNEEQVEYFISFVLTTTRVNTYILWVYFFILVKVASVTRSERIICSFRCSVITFVKLVPIIYKLQNITYKILFFKTLWLSK